MIVGIYQYIEEVGHGIENSYALLKNSGTNSVNRFRYDREDRFVDKRTFSSLNYFKSNVKNDITNFKLEFIYE